MRAIIPSLTTKNIEYEIKIEEGKPVCDCPHFMYRKTMCKHMKKLVDETPRSV